MYAANKALIYAESTGRFLSRSDMQWLLEEDRTARNYVLAAAGFVAAIFFILSLNIYLTMLFGAMSVAVVFIFWGEMKFRADERFREQRRRRHSLCGLPESFPILEDGPLSDLRA